MLINGLDGIIRSALSTGGFRCEGVEGLCSTVPFVIYVVPSKNATPAEHADVTALQDQLMQLALMSSPMAKRAHVLCGGINGYGCHALGNPNCRKLLLLTSRGTKNFQLPGAVALSDFGGNGDLIIPVLPASEQARFSQVFPPEISPMNALFWSGDIGRLAPTIISRTGLSTDEEKIFLSYRRSESDDLAEQLFEELSKNRFNVYVDRFRTDPGINFQQRLRAELADKSVVLFLETPEMLTSEWTTYEIAFAKQHRLGRLGLSYQGQHEIPDIGHEFRHSLDVSDFDNTPTDSPYWPGLLTQSALEKAVNRIRELHTRAVAKRRFLLRRQMVQALIHAKVTDINVSDLGTLEVQASPVNPKYTIMLTTCAPDMPDFHTCSTVCSHPARPVIIGLSRYLEVKHRTRLEWLSGVSNTQYFDEGRMYQVAADISSGAL